MAASDWRRAAPRLAQASLKLRDRLRLGGRGGGWGALAGWRASAAWRRMGGAGWLGRLCGVAAVAGPRQHIPPRDMARRSHGASPPPPAGGARRGDCADVRGMAGPPAARRGRRADGRRRARPCHSSVSLVRVTRPCHSSVSLIRVTRPCHSSESLVRVIRIENVPGRPLTAGRRSLSTRWRWPST